MHVSMRALIWVGIPAFLVGLMLGVAIGRLRAPFDLAGIEAATGAFGIRSDPAAITASEVERLLKDGVPVTLVDVRDSDEFAAYHLATAQSIPLRALWSRANEIPRDRTVVVYCTGGPEGQVAASELSKLGWPNVRHLEGSPAVWQSAGLTVVE